MTAKPSSSILHHFSSIEDPRVNRQKKHKLQDIFFISICAVICSADNWVAIEEFGLSKKKDWFTEVLGLEHGIASHDTFGEVYAAIDTDHQFSLCFSRWVSDLANITEGQVYGTGRFGRQWRFLLSIYSYKSPLVTRSAIGTWSS